MAGIKRDYQGNMKHDNRKEGPHNAYTSMFESFRDELDEHHDRRMKIEKVSRDVTALSKKIIFSLQRVRKLSQPIPARIQSEIDERQKEIVSLLSTIEDDVKGMNRYRYPLICLEEFVEAVSFSHYLQYQTLTTPDQAQTALSPVQIPLTGYDYVFGIFDLTGEMMRFATSVTALTGSIPTVQIQETKSGSQEHVGDESKPTEAGHGVKREVAASPTAEDSSRSILNDLQEASSMLQICPPFGRKGIYAKKLSIMLEQVRKVERLGYGVSIRGNERPKGWVPDLNETSRNDGGGGDTTME